MKPSPLVGSIERLESRIAPAAALRSVNFVDVDGDVVHVTVSGVSQGDLTGKLTFIDHGSGREQLVSINLTSPLFAKNNLSITVDQANGGDGFVQLGTINAKGVDLGDVSIQGDVDVITAGDAKTSTPGMGKLSLRGLGTGINLEANGYTSTITGSVGDVTLTGNLTKTHLAIVGGPLVTVGNVTAGDLIGGTNPFSGSITSTGTIGNISVHNMTGSSGIGGGSIMAPAIGNFTASVLTGGSMPNTGSLLVPGSAKTVTVDGLAGGSGASSGAILLGGMGDFRDNGSLVGSSGLLSGSLQVKSLVGNIIVADTLLGGAKDNTGSILVNGMGDLTVGLSITGGGGNNSGAIIDHGVAGDITVQNGQAVGGGSGTGSGSIQVDGSAQAISLTGALVGNAGISSGLLSVKGGASSLYVRSIAGGAKASSGSVFIGGSLSSVNIPGSITGDVGDSSGQLHVVGQLGSVAIGGAITGGAGPSSGSIRSEAGIDSVVVTGAVASGGGPRSGSITTGGNLGSVTIHSTVTGTAGKPVVISAAGVNSAVAGSVPTPSIGTVTIDGAVEYLSVLAGYDVTGKGVNAGAQIDTIHLGASAKGTNFVAGATIGTVKFFGLLGNAIIPKSAGIVSSIANVIIDGNTFSTPNDDNFGIVAQQVNAVSVNGAVVALTAGPHKDRGIAVGSAADFTIFEA